jgi:hypothetical protein
LSRGRRTRNFSLISDNDRPAGLQADAPTSKGEKGNDQAS